MEDSGRRAEEGETSQSILGGREAGQVGATGPQGGRERPKIPLHWDPGGLQREGQDVLASSVSLRPGHSPSSGLQNYLSSEYDVNIYGSVVADIP